MGDQAESIIRNTERIATSVAVYYIVLLEQGLGVEFARELAMAFHARLLELAIFL